VDIFIQQIINGLILGSVYALVALGYTMVYGIINLINFAHGEVLMVGALTSWTVVTWLDKSGSPPRSSSARCSTSRSRRSPTGRCATRRASRR
jgi:branched-subunit amino acid ABC-type transport system permease component